MPNVIEVEQCGHILRIGLNRAAKRNAFNVEMLEELGRAYERLENDDEVRVGVLYAHGDHFTAGLDLAEVGPRLAGGGLHLGVNYTPSLHLASWHFTGNASS